MPSNKLGLRRDQLLKISSDPDVIRQIEKLFKAVNDLSRDWCFLTLSTSQTVNLTGNNHIQWDVIQKSGTFDVYKDDLSTPSDWGSDTGQDLGIVELKAKKTYKIKSGVGFSASSPGYVNYICYDRTNSVNRGILAQAIAPSYSSNDTITPFSFAKITPTADIKIETRIISQANVTSIGYAYCMIEQIKNED